MLILGGNRNLEIGKHPSGKDSLNIPSYLTKCINSIFICFNYQSSCFETGPGLLVVYNYFTSYAYILDFFSKIPSKIIIQKITIIITVSNKRAGKVIVIRENKNSFDIKLSPAPLILCAHIPGERVSFEYLIKSAIGINISRFDFS